MAIQGGMGLAQTIIGATKKKEPLPEYNISPEIQDSYNMAKSELGSVSRGTKSWNGYVGPSDCEHR